MEVNQAGLFKHLLDILSHLSNASFVTIDMEMGGIQSQRITQNNRKPLQQIYHELKIAAERYHVVQFGITIVEADIKKEYYLARPYNFFVSPLSAPGCNIKLDRTFSFTSSSIEFLMSHGFDITKVFKEGLTYLNYDEEKKMRKDYKERFTRKEEDIQVEQQDLPTVEFYNDARDQINEWLTEDNPEFSFVNVTNAAGSMNGYQRRLIFQLVQNEFPTCRTFPRNKGAFMQVVLRDEQQDEQELEKRHNRFNEQIGKQIGLRWLLDALTGADLSKLNPEWLIDEQAEDAELELQSVTTSLQQIKSKLKERRPILVGHNLFADLCFFYSIYFGDLPAKIWDFAAAITTMFPHIIDTKFLATCGDNVMDPRFGLKEYLQPYKTIHVPLIVLEEAHSSYGASFGKEHEAGFDSWMTAEYFVKKVAHMYASYKQERAPAPSSDGSPAAPAVAELGVGQWIPSIEDGFWKPFFNQLRVYGCEAGFADLNVHLDPENH